MLPSLKLHLAELGITLGLGGALIAGILWTIIYTNRGEWWTGFPVVFAMPPSLVPFFVLLAAVAGPKQPGNGEALETSIEEVTTHL